MKILIDTNIYLDFYRSNNGALKLFDEIEKHFDKILITDQIIVEFERSRETVINHVRKNFESESNLVNFSSSLLQNLPEFKDLLNVQNQYLDQRKKVSNILKEMAKSQLNDPVAFFFKTLVDKSLEADNVLVTSTETIAKAHNRKLVGNPPTTVDKYSIGDEINWEIILANVKDDIIIVGRDNTFKNNLNFLQKEFTKVTGRYIFKLTPSIIDAFTMIGVDTSDELKALEQQMIIELQHSSNFWQNALFNEE